MKSKLTTAFKYYCSSEYDESILGTQHEVNPEIFTKQSTQPVLLGKEDIVFDESDFISEKKSKYKNNYKRIFNPKQIGSPFAASQIVEDGNKRIWIYIDEYDIIQGPFTTIEMDYWYNNHMFPMDLLIGLADRERCIRLGDFIISSYPFSKNPNLHIKRTVQELS